MDPLVPEQLTGGYVWHRLHAGSFGSSEQVLAVGVIAALIAAGVQGALAGPAARRLRAGGGEAARDRLALAQRIAAVLLAVTLVCMVIARDV